MASAKWPIFISCFHLCRLYDIAETTGSERTFGQNGLFCKAELNIIAFNCFCSCATGRENVCALDFIPWAFISVFPEINVFYLDFFLLWVIPYHLLEVLVLLTTHAVLNRKYFVFMTSLSVIQSLCNSALFYTGTNLQFLCCSVKKYG